MKISGTIVTIDLEVLYEQGITHQHNFGSGGYQVRRSNRSLGNTASFFNDLSASRVLVSLLALTIRVPKNPTRSKAEEVLGAIESADYALATSSGMSAIVLAFSVFPVGSKILAVRDLYGGSFRWFNQVEQEGRFHFTYANTEEELIAELEKDVDVLYIETPTNPLMLEFDIANCKTSSCQGCQSCGGQYLL